jgi:hypothetical protein
MSWKTLSAPVLATLLVAALAYAGATRPPPEPAPKPAHSHPAIALRGHVTDLYPGERARLAVTARNRSPRPVRLRFVGARVKAAGADCAARYLRVRGRHPRRLVAPGERVRVRLRVRLSRHAPDACAGAVWPLRFRSAGRFEPRGPQ